MRSFRLRAFRASVRATTAHLPSGHLGLNAEPKDVPRVLEMKCMRFVTKSMHQACGRMVQVSDHELGGGSHEFESLKM